MTAGMERARALAKTAVAQYKARKKAAEASVATWQWASRQTVSVEPGFFECTNIGRGKKLATAPAKTGKANYQVEEGFDAHGRLVVMREYTNQWDGPYERFYFYEPNGIIGIRYVSGEHLGYAQWLATDRDKVTAADTVYEAAARSKVYRFDANGHYAGFTDIGKYEDTPIDQPFDIECNADGKIVRTWWVWPRTGKRDLYWEHSSVKGKKPAVKKAAPKKSAPKKPAPKKPAPKKPAARKR